MSHGPRTPKKQKEIQYIPKVRFEHKICLKLAKSRVSSVRSLITSNEDMMRTSLEAEAHVPRSQLNCHIFSKIDPYNGLVLERILQLKNIYLRKTM